MATRNKLTHVQIVRQIIDEELRTNGKVSKWYVIEELKNRIHPTELFNRICGSSKATTDGITNMHRGAMAMCSDALYKSKDRYVMNADGLITTIMKPEPARTATELFCC